MSIERSGARAVLAADPRARAGDGGGLRAAGRTAARLARQVELGLGEVELSLPQYRVLMLLARQSELASRLADHLAVSRPSVTSVVDGLVGRGLVVRVPDVADRRRVGHSLTDAGRDLLGRADEAVERRFGAIAGHMAGEGERAEALAGLEIWRRALDAHRAARLEGRQ
ncbi:MAG TPA: MarR family transcriptional regulator [Acidimicrobiales bacterium]|nr:MarR family transcriptional regulator [Acidimicrobiales bacterium]